MRFVVFLKLGVVVILLGGCAIHKAEQEKNIAFLSAGVTAEKGLSTRDVVLRGNLAGEVANGSGTDIGMAALMLLNSGDFQVKATKQDHLEVWMPVSEASNEKQAKMKMSSILESAINKTFSSPYKTKIDEIEDIATTGAKSIGRFIRIDGPGCENWSCRVNATILSEINVNSSYGDMFKYEHSIPGQHCPCYVYMGLAGIGGFVKITKEYVEQGVFNGYWHRFETKPMSFGGEEFYIRLSENLPDWVYYYVAKQPPGTDMKVPALFNKGKRVK